MNERYPNQSYGLQDLLVIPPRLCLTHRMVRTTVRTIVHTMAKKKIRRHQIRKITKTAAYTYYVTLPKEELDALGWREHQKVVVRRQGKRFVIEDWKPKR